LAKFEELTKSNFNAVRSSPPFFVSGSWHSTQCFSIKAKEVDGKIAAAPGKAVASHVTQSEWIFQLITKT